MSDLLVSQVWPLKLKAPEQMLILVLAHAADDQGVVRDLAEGDLIWMLGEYGARLYTTRQSLVKQGLIERIAGEDEVAPDVYELHLDRAKQRKPAPLDCSITAASRMAIIQAFGCTCQQCGNGGSLVFDAAGQVWRLGRLHAGHGLSAENVTLLCASCATQKDIALDRLPSAADKGLMWGHRHWSYPGSRMLSVSEERN